MRPQPVYQPPRVEADADTIKKALADRGLSVHVYDFIAHNWGKPAALVALLTAEPR